MKGGLTDSSRQLRRAAGHTQRYVCGHGVQAPACCCWVGLLMLGQTAKQLHQLFA